QNPPPRSQFGSRRGCPAQHELPGRGTERAIRSRWSRHGATSPRASNSLKRSLPRKNVSSICCPVTSSASRLVLLNWPPPGHLWIGTKSRHVLLPQRVTNASASIPAETAARTRIVSKARIRLDHRKSVRPFKGIFCHDISEFESSHPSHAVQSLPVPPPALAGDRIHPRPNG